MKQILLFQFQRIGGIRDEWYFKVDPLITVSENGKILNGALQIFSGLRSIGR